MSAMTNFVFMNKVVVECIEDKLAKTFNEYVDTQKLYEEELKRSHVYKTRVEELKLKVQSLEGEVASLRDKLKTIETQSTKALIEKRVFVDFREVKVKTKGIQVQ